VTAMQPPLRLRWVGLGLLLLQFAWIVAIPPFAGMDEWDHAYRASAVAHGQLVAPPSEATRGTGAFVTVPSDIVRAARVECERLNYGGRNECVGTAESGFTEVASGAGRYPPTYYAMVGWPSIFLDGNAALYGMRLASLLWCWLLLMATFRVLNRWAGPLAGFVVCIGLTPTLVYASAVVAPNGLEMVSGLALWTAVASLALDRQQRAFDAWTLGLGLVSCSLLLSLRALGPMWAVLIAGVALIAWAPAWSRILELLRTRRGIAAATWLVAVTASSIWWVRSQDALVVGRSEAGVMSVGQRLRETMIETLVWT
jgi:hypothetical protein